MSLLDSDVVITRMDVAGAEFEPYTRFWLADMIFDQTNLNSVRIRMPYITSGLVYVYGNIPPSVQKSIQNNIPVTTRVEWKGEHDD